MDTRVLVEISDHVAVVTLNRAAKRNAVDVQMFQELIATAEMLKNNNDIRAVVLHGAGDSFCAGIDISVFQGEGIAAFDSELLQPVENSPANFFQAAAYAWRQVPVPVIAALHGAVFGAGLQIAMGADIRFASPDVKMSIMEIKWGIIPDMAISTTLRHIVAPDKVKELAWTGRVVSGVEAAALGLVTELSADPLAKAHALAKDVCGRSPDAVRAIKQLINESWHEDHAAALRREATLQAALLGGANQAEAVAANMQKREPQFIAPKV